MIYKYTMPQHENVVLDLPKGAQVLSVLNQREDLVLYAKVDPDTSEIEPQQFAVRGTGHRFTGEEGTFIGTVSFMGGSFILHVFHRK